jgi:hypothetical protein
MLAQAISTAQARLKVAKAVASAAAAAAAQQPMCSGKSCFDLSKFMQGRQARAAPAGPTAYGVLVGNHMSMYGARAGVHSGQFKGYAPPRLAVQHSSGASGPCTAGPSSNGSGDSTSSSRAGGKGQKAAVVTVVLATEGQVRAGNKVVKARSSGGRRSSGSSSGGSNNSSSVPDFTQTPKAFRKLHRCAATRGAPHPADAAQTGTLREADLELLFSNSAAAGKRAGRESGMLSAPATPRGSSGGARNSRVSISSQDSGSVDLQVLLRNSSWGSSSLGGCSSLERSSSCGSLPEASLQLQQLPVVSVLPVIAGNISTAGASGSWGMGRVCALVLVIVFLLVLVGYAMQQCLARVCSSVVSDGSGGTTTAVFF